MTSLAARVTMIEQVVTRLVTSRGPKVSAELRMARTRAMAGEVAPVVLHSVEDLERRARGTGLSAAMAKAALRVARGLPPDGLSAAGYSRQDAVVDGGGGNPAAPVLRGSTAPETALAGPSVSGALVDRIDTLLAVHARV